MSACEEFGPLISAMLDDELSTDERSRVDQHLHACSACRRRSKVFAELDRLASPAAPVPSSDWRDNIGRRVRIRQRKQRLSWAATYVAAAVVLIAMIGTILHFRRANSGRVVVDPGAAIVNREQATIQKTENNVIGPLETLQIVSRQEQRTYDAMRRLMEWDLRALKLELKQMELTPDQVEQLSSRIEMLIERVERAGNGPNATGTGESI